METLTVSSAIHFCNLSLRATRGSADPSAQISLSSLRLISSVLFRSSNSVSKTVYSYKWEKNCLLLPGVSSPSGSKRKTISCCSIPATMHHNTHPLSSCLCLIRAPRCETSMLRIFRSPCFRLPCLTCNLNDTNLPNKKRKRSLLTKLQLDALCNRPSKQNQSVQTVRLHMQLSFPTFETQVEAQGMPQHP